MYKHKMGMHSKKMRIPTGAHKYHTPKQKLKTVGMMPRDAYNHGRAHTTKKVMGPRVPMGATL